jgi:DNA-binding CsgD family transcriptional regulator
MTLLFMVAGFAVMRSLGPAGRTLAFSRPLLYVYAVVAAAGSLIPFMVPGATGFWTVAEGALTGLPLAYLIAAWGRVFGREATINSVPEIFLGSLVGALVFLVFSMPIPSNVAEVVFRLLPLASVVNIEVPSDGDQRTPATLESASGEARTLSAKIVVGTVCFGLAEGLIDGAGFSAGFGVAYFQTGIVVYGAFLIGGLTLLLSDGFGRGDALNNSYRLAAFVMIAGFLIFPGLWHAGVGSAAASLALAGFLGLEAVLVSLFVVMAKITATDSASSFAAGFSALFGGEFLGIAAVNAARGMVGDALVFAVVAAGGILALLGYVFLFTERDFGELSQIVTVNDVFEDTCAEVTRRFGLSNRESEILAFALRGRTNERIAQEFVIAKSTVDTHLRRISSKCGVHSRQELLDLAEEIAKEA